MINRNLLIQPVPVSPKDEWFRVVGVVSRFMPAPGPGTRAVSSPSDPFRDTQSGYDPPLGTPSLAPTFPHISIVGLRPRRSDRRPKQDSGHSVPHSPSSSLCLYIESSSTGEDV